MPAVLPSDGDRGRGGRCLGSPSPDLGKLQSAPQLPEAQAPGHPGATGPKGGQGTEMGRTTKACAQKEAGPSWHVGFSPLCQPKAAVDQPWI